MIKVEISITVDGKTFTHMAEMPYLPPSKYLDVLNFIKAEILHRGKNTKNIKLNKKTGFIELKTVPIKLSEWSYVLPADLIKYFGGWAHLEVYLGRMMGEGKKIIITKWSARQIEEGGSIGSTVGSYIGSKVGNYIQNQAENYVDNKISQYSVPAGISLGFA